MIRTRAQIDNDESVLFSLLRVQTRNVLEMIAGKLASNLNFIGLDAANAGIKEVLECLQFDEVAVRSFYTTPNHSEAQFEVYIRFNDFSHVEKIWFRILP